MLLSDPNRPLPPSPSFSRLLQTNAKKDPEPNVNKATIQPMWASALFCFPSILYIYIFLFFHSKFEMFAITGALRVLESEGEFHTNYTAIFGQGSTRHADTANGELETKSGQICKRIKPKLAAQWTLCFLCCCCRCGRWGFVSVRVLLWLQISRI